MKDTELYARILGLEMPWSVAEVRLDLAEERVDVVVKHKRGLLWPCPECGDEMSLRDHSAERVWRHRDTCQLQTFLHARPPRVECPTHGVKQVRLPWAEARSRFVCDSVEATVELAIGGFEERMERGIAQKMRQWPYSSWFRHLKE